MLQEKCYKNNHDELRHRGRGSIRDINTIFIKKKEIGREKKFLPGVSDVQWRA